MLEDVLLWQELKLEGAKGGVAILGAGVSLITLNHWVALATLLYIVVQIFILLEKRHYRVKDRKAKNGGDNAPHKKKKKAKNN